MLTAAKTTTSHFQLIAFLHMCKKKTRHLCRHWKVYFIHVFPCKLELGGHVKGDFKSTLSVFLTSATSSCLNNFTQETFTNLPQRRNLPARHVRLSSRFPSEAQSTFQCLFPQQQQTYCVYPAFFPTDVPEHEPGGKHESQSFTGSCCPQQESTEVWSV